MLFTVAACANRFSMLPSATQTGMAIILFPSELSSSDNDATQPSLGLTEFGNDKIPQLDKLPL